MPMPKNFTHKYNKSLWKNALIQHIYFLSIYYRPGTELAPLLPKEIRQIGRHSQDYRRLKAQDIHDKITGKQGS